MSTRHSTPAAAARTFHPRALTALGALACIAMLSVARDLRSGAIPPENYNQATHYGTSCCIYGHVRKRLDDINNERLVHQWHPRREIGLMDLFNGHRPSNPQQAACAIERYIYEGAEQPWAEAP